MARLLPPMARDSGYSRNSISSLLFSRSYSTHSHTRYYSVLCSRNASFSHFSHFCQSPTSCCAFKIVWQQSLSRFLLMSTSKVTLKSLGSTWYFTASALSRDKSESSICGEEEAQAISQAGQACHKPTFSHPIKHLCQTPLTQASVLHLVLRLAGPSR